LQAKPTSWSGERDGERSQSSIFNLQSGQAKRRQKTPCFLCSWNRRKAIFSFAQERGFNKVALGHHQDDILTTLLMNMIYEGSIQTMPPKLKMKHYPVEIIRPLCLVSEKMIGEEAERLGFEKQKTPCPYDRQTKRKEINDLFHQLEAMNPEARYSLWHSMRNIHPDLLV
jgi:tRNA(Ile)-lysidine synthase TilS/MesJ